MAAIFDDSATFGVNRCELLDEHQTRSQIQTLVAQLPAQSHLVVDGYTDSRGDPSAMLELARCRAQLIASVIVQEDPTAHVEVAAHGVDDLRDPTCQDCAENRVATVTVLG